MGSLDKKGLVKYELEASTTRMPLRIFVLAELSFFIGYISDTSGYVLKFYNISRKIVKIYFHSSIKNLQITKKHTMIFKKLFMRTENLKKIDLKKIHLHIFSIK